MNVSNPPQPAALEASSPTETPARIRRQRSQGLDLVIVQSGSLSELHLTLTPRATETPVELAGRLAAVLGEWNAVPVRQFVFGSVAAFHPFQQALSRALNQNHAVEMGSAPAPGAAGRALASRLWHRESTHDSGRPAASGFGARAHRTAPGAGALPGNRTEWFRLNAESLPMTLVEGDSCRGQQIAGIQVHAISGAPVEIRRNNGWQTTSWQDARARHCVLTTAGPGGVAGKSHPEQAAGVFEQWQEDLATRGWSMKDVARTWFYLDDILNWYGDFNQVRNDFFARCELRAGHVPASTGVSGRNQAQTALAAMAWALQPHDADTRAFDFVASPRQCPAPAYGSAFSRAVEIHSAGFRQLLVSGTASIAPDGKTAHVGDVTRQIELSMQVVNDILASRAMSFADVSRATAYFAAPEDLAVWEQWQTAHGLKQLPVVCACCDICRDDLRFEIELDALKSDGR